MDRFLTAEQHEAFDNFLKQRNIRRVRLAQILGLKTGSSITYYFNHKCFKRTDYEEVMKVLEKEALKGFDKVRF